MSTPRFICTAKVVAILGFLVLLTSVYYLRTEVLKLNEIRCSSDEARAEYDLQQFRKDFPNELEQHRVAVKNYELQARHYEEMLELYQTDHKAYMSRVEGEYRPPQMPDKPRSPQPPEYKQKLMEINTQFRAQKHHYFQTTGVLNWVAMVAALCLVGGLLYLIMFDTANGRLVYFMTLVLSFVFLIGPAFHSIMSAIVGFLQAPRIY